tara:strand:+ start:3759 stop:3974 length:216 start_codon:yes stop_codon:yes gene_type:complete
MIFITQHFYLLRGSKMARTTRKKSQEQISSERENRTTRALKSKSRSNSKKILRQIDYTYLEEVDDEELYGV